MLEFFAFTLPSLLSSGITFAQTLDFIGTVAFAISGIRLASAKKFDLFGAYVVGLTTAIGGGTIRDLLIGVPIFWMTNPFYLVSTGIGLLWVMAFGKLLIKQQNTWFLFDTIGLAVFTITGLEKTLAAGFPFWTAILMGAMTGAAGGVIRDVFINEVPLIFRKEVYAMACVIGGLAYWFCLRIVGMETMTSGIVCGLVVIATRLLAVRFHLSLPVLRSEGERGEAPKE